MIKENYRKLFWGFIITLLDFRLNNFNMLPDMVGYLLIVGALGELAEEHEDYNRAKKLALILMLLAIPDIFQVNNVLQGLNIGDTYSLVTLLLSAIGTILNLLMIYYICSAIFELSRQKQLDELTTMTVARWRGYLIIKIIVLVSMPFTINLPEGLGMTILLTTGLAGFIVQIMMISLIKQSGIELSNVENLS